MNDVASNEKKARLIYLFDKPEKAFYVTNPSWSLETQNIITEDARYVMGFSHLNTDYKPVPFEVFKKFMENLAGKRALEIKPSQMYESIDFDPQEASIRDTRFRYFLDASGILVRLRNDEKGIHTMMLIGKKDGLTKIAEENGLPHPFDASKYPYKNLFRDESHAEGKIRALI